MPAAGGRETRATVWFHRASAAVWALLAVPALLWWPESVAFVIIASIYANVKSDIGAAEAADDRRVLDRLDDLERLITGARAAADVGVPMPGELMVDAVFPDGTHWYWSTHCRHGRHDDCAATEVNGGPRRPAQCKTCAAPCRCWCHRGGDGG